MAARQPSRLPSGAPSGAVANAAAPGGGMPASMEEIQRLRQHVEANPGDADAILLLANLNTQIQNWQRAAELYERRLALRPDDPDVLTDLGSAQRGLGEPEKALATLRRAQALAPRHWQSRYNEVVILAFDLGRPAEARQALAPLIEMQPDNSQVAELAAEVARLGGK
jgi:tetratricopeptide (TPR) repeat protein